MPFLPDIGERASRWAAALDTTEAAALVREGRGDELRDAAVQRLLGEAPADESILRPGIVYWSARARATRADHGPRRRGARPGRRGRLRPARVSRAARPGARRRRTHLRRQGARTLRDAAGRRSMPCWSIALSRARRSCASRAAIRSCSAAAARSCSRASSAGVPFEVVPGDHERRRRAGAGGHPGHASGVAQSFAVVTGSTAHGDDVDLAARRDRDRHARGADGGREARRNVRRADRVPGARPPNPRRSSSGRRPRSNARRGHARRPAVAGRGGASGRRPRSSWARSSRWPITAPTDAPSFAPLVREVPPPGLRFPGWNRSPPRFAPFDPDAHAVRTRRSGGASSSARSSCCSRCSRCTCCGRRC